METQPDADPIDVCHTDSMFDNGNCNTENFDHMMVAHPRVVARYLDELFIDHLRGLEGCPVPPDGYFEGAFLGHPEGADAGFMRVWDEVLMRIMDAGYPVFEGDSEYLYFEVYPKTKQFAYRGN